MLYSCDEKWWRLHGGVPSFKGRKFSRQASGYEDVRKAPDATILGDHRVFRETGANSGYQTILLEACRGHRRQLLLGFDCMFGPGKTPHFHGKHPAPLSNPGQINFDRWIEWFGRLAPALKDLGFEIINCSRSTALTVFPCMPLETALALS